MCVWRYRVGRWLVHFGLWIIPSGRARTELYALFYQWGRDVLLEVAAQKRMSQ